MAGESCQTKALDVWSAASPDHFEEKPLQAEARETEEMQEVPSLRLREGCAAMQHSTLAKPKNSNPVETPALSEAQCVEA
jgi:hypothetical protein